jgi:hypothetical protein
MDTNFAKPSFSASAFAFASCHAKQLEMPIFQAN